MKMLNDRKQYDDVLNLFGNLKKTDKSKISPAIITQALKACAGTQNLQIGKSIYQMIPSNMTEDSYINASLINLFMTCGEITDAQLIFDRSKSKTISMYGAMMKGYVRHNLEQKAIDLYHQISQPNAVIMTILFNACAKLRTDDALNVVHKASSTMSKEFFSNRFVVTSMLDALMKCGEVKLAENIFNKVKINDLPMCRAMMKGYIINDQAIKAVQMFQDLEKKNFFSSNQLHPGSNSVTYLCLINALANVGDMSMAEGLLKNMSNSLIEIRSIANALIDMWGKVGRVDRAKEMFRQLRQPDHISYSSMINALGLNGMGSKAIEVYHQTPEQLRNTWTHVCVLNACSHSGLVSEARTLFETMPEKSYMIVTAMIDCLSRASHFDEAQQLIKQYEEKHSPDYAMYMSLLSGARNRNDASLSRQVFEKMKRLFPTSNRHMISAAILLSNTLASSGNMEAAVDIKDTLNKSGKKKKSGLSWTVINGQYAAFRAHDRSHPRSEEIYAEIDRISSELIKFGHQYDSSWIPRPLDENETVASVLCGHSERLAIAWNFVENPNAKQIQIGKNLRVCGDCHRATKLIAKIRHCHIIVRDANRLHHFDPNGQCSCGDYF